ncbi:tRNA glutamyl-Q(34) synthetase GluQRS [Beijerinckia sp. L45]|uniref:tRNA glutamyl-Q(34) synthetase GluQRS n=1 Tax=Beijerinckia sp. L45 TaxID=1641855 RepID=UPI00131B85C6|nr:tRNA glutamyl-Q(34) synthetase GluQRS [Beijerinckia sp. L45]
MTSSFNRPVLRFAPSPNGYLHLGHAYSALMNALIARETGGRLLLRMEDIDVSRCRPEFETAIKDDLAWLGMQWEEPVRRQAEHFADYTEALDRLESRGLVYPCFCSRGDIMAAVSHKPNWPRDPDGTPVYPGLCKHLSPAARAKRFAHGEKASYRLDMERALAQASDTLTWSEFGGGSTRWEKQATPGLWGDAVLSRKDIATSYHIAVVVDDALQGVTDVVRGEDLFMATSLHRMLQVLLDLPAPCYHHHPLVRDVSGQKLSKSLRAKPLRTFRQDGLSVEAVLAKIALPSVAMGGGVSETALGAVIAAATVAQEP